MITLRMRRTLESSSPRPAERRDLPRLDLIERGVQPDDHVVDALGLGEVAGLRRDVVGLRDSRRASRSGGATKVTVSLIGEGFGVR